MATKQAKQTPAPAADAAVYVSPDGARYRIGSLVQGKATYWRTERLTDDTWEAANTSVYPRYEDAQGEFDAWIRREALVPAEAAPPALPVFDYGGLSKQTVATLHSAENMIRTARREYIVRVADAVGMVHDELVTKCDKRNNQYSEDTFLAWCASVGLNRMTAYRLLQVSNLISSSTPNEQKMLEQAPPSLLYAAAKPSAPPEAVAAVKSGAVTTHRQYQGLLEEIRQRDAKIDELTGQTEKLERALDDVSAAKHAAQESAGEAEKAQKAAERRAKDAEAAKDIAQQSLRQASYERDTAKNLLKSTKKQLEKTQSELEALRAQPVSVAVEQPDPAELDRLAAEKAAAMTAGLQAQLQQSEAECEALRSRADAAPDPNEDYDTLLLALRAMRTLWQSVCVPCQRLPQRMRSGILAKITETLDGILDDARQFCEEKEAAPDAGM